MKFKIKKYLPLLPLISVPVFTTLISCSEIATHIYIALKEILQRYQILLNNEAELYQEMNELKMKKEII